MLFQRRGDLILSRPISVYVAGGYPTRSFVGEVAQELYLNANINITYNWWANEDKPDNVQIQARHELAAIRWTEIMIVLDRSAGTGTSFEMGYFMGLDRGEACVWVTLDQAIPQLQWFGSVLDGKEIATKVKFGRLSVPQWDVKTIVSALIG